LKSYKLKRKEIYTKLEILSKESKSKLEEDIKEELDKKWSKFY
jgi:hypothetical protein